MTCAERYAKLKAEHRCVDCKIQLSASNKFTKCDHCREYDRLYKKRPKRRQPSAKPEGVLTISQVIALATERHVSYGEMVLLRRETRHEIQNRRYSKSPRAWGWACYAGVRL